MNPAFDTVGRFDGLAARYDRYRPTYPAAAIAAILAGLPDAPIVADIGAGTGISTRLLAASGARAIAIEPNDDMRALVGSDAIDVRAGKAEATGLAAGSVDAVTCFQAFHWFATDAAVREFARILRARGRLAIVWNERDLDTAFGRAYRDLEVRTTEPGMLAGANFSDDRLAPLLSANGFTAPRLRTFENVQRFDRDGLLGRLRSSSYAPREGAKLEAMTADASALFDAFVDDDGFVSLTYVTEVWLADVSAP